MFYNSIDVGKLRTTFVRTQITQEFVFINLSEISNLNKILK